MSDIVVGFCYGVIFVSVINVLSTSPDVAIKNLKSWMELFQ